jgi:outer membrane protein
MRLKRFRISNAVLAAGLAAVLTSTLPLAARAQSLQELYDAARTYDASFLAARALAESAEYRAAQVESLARPSLSAGAKANYGQTEFETLGSLDTKTTQGTLDGRYSLFNRANGVEIEQARKVLEAAKADLETAEQDLIVRVAQAYFDVLASLDSLNNTRANKAAITEQLASAKRNFEVGTATIVDSREAQARFDLASAQEIAADNDLRNKRAALDQLVGRSAVSPKGLSVPVLLPASVSISSDDWVTQADALHPQVRKARLALDVATLETGKARAGQLPTVDAIGQLFVQDARGSAVQLPGRQTGASIGVQLNWPIYTGGSVQNRIKETLSLEERSRNDLDAARRGVALNTRVTYNGVQSLLAQVRALEAAEASTKLALEATQLGYKVGVRVNLDVLNAQRDLFQTQRDLARSRYDVLVGGLRLRQASGQLVPSDIDIVNRLLAK